MPNQTRGRAESSTVRVPCGSAFLVFEGRAACRCCIGTAVRLDVWVPRAHMHPCTHAGIYPHVHTHAPTRPVPMLWQSQPNTSHLSWGAAHTSPASELGAMGWGGLRGLLTSWPPPYGLTPALVSSRKSLGTSFVLLLLLLRLWLRGSYVSSLGSDALGQPNRPSSATSCSPRLRVAHEDTPILTSIPELGLVLLLPAVEADAIAWA